MGYKLPLQAKWLLIMVLAATSRQPAAADAGMATGDFNGDGKADLAVGVPNEDITFGGTARINAGAVNVIYGSDLGLHRDRARPDQFLYQGRTLEGNVIADVPAAGELFGFSLAAGDFNNDSYDDLAIGVPGQSVGGDANAGAVHIFYGSAGGLTAKDDVVWHRDSAGVADPAVAGDSFGFSLAAGDFNGDTFDDLAVGVPYDDPGAEDAGSVHILHGSSGGIRATDDAATAGVNEDDAIWHQDVGTIEGVQEEGAHFGFSLAVGNFNGDAYDDLAVGVPDEDVANALDDGPEAGIVNVIYGSATGLDDAGNRAFFQDTDTLSGLADTAESGDHFGFALAVGDFNGDGIDDLAVGVPGEDISIGILVIPDAGAVNVIYGKETNGLGTTDNQFWNQASAAFGVGIGGDPEEGDEFGRSLVAGDFNNDGYNDLAVGVPFDDVTSGVVVIADAGAVNVIYGSADRLTTAGNKRWHQNSTDVEDACETMDRFGMSLAAGDFDGDSRADLAVGVPAESITTGLVAVGHAGAVNAIYGSAEGLHQSLGRADQFWHQNSAGIDDQNEQHDHFGGGRIPD